MSIPKRDNGLIAKKGRESEFGEVLGGGLGGSVIRIDYDSEGSGHKKGDVVFISGAFNPLSSLELRRIATFMDQFKKKKKVRAARA
jgi:hypothetical protein